MAKKVWTGASSNSFHLAGNWSPSGIPTTGDELYFVDATLNPCTSDMDRTALDSINFALVHVGRRYNRDLGTAADPLKAGIDELAMEGPNTAYFKTNNDGSPNLAIDNIVQKAGSLKLDLASGTVQTTELLIENGKCTLQAGNIVTVRCTGNVALDILAAMVIATTIEMDRGLLVTDFAGHDVINMGRSTVILQGAAAVTTGLAKIDNRSGIIRYKSSGDITNLDLRRGASLVVDGNDNEGPMTIALLRSIGGHVDWRNTTRNVVATTWQILDGASTQNIPARTTVTLGGI